MSKKKRKIANLGKVITPVGHPNPPEQHEVEVATILARHYQTAVEFIVPVDDYLRKSADIEMLGVQWEIKSPTGSSKATIENQFRRASKQQAKNIVIDTRRTTLDYDSIVKSVLYAMKARPSMRKVKKIILIDKFENVVAIKE